MEESISGIEKLIGFIYRILFTIIPSGAFLCVSFVFLNYYNGDTITKIKDLFLGINSFWQIVLPLSLIFSLSFFIESIVVLVFYRMMGFQKISNSKNFKNKKLPKIYDLYDLTNSKGKEPGIEYFIGKNQYHLSVVKSLMNHPRVYNQIYYYLGREFVFNNLTVVTLLIANCYAPYTIYNFYGTNTNGHYWLYQGFQPIISVVYLWFSYYVLKKYDKYKADENRKEIEGDNFFKILKSYFSLIHKIPHSFYTICAISLIISVFLFSTSSMPSLSSFIKYPFPIYLAFNILLFPVVAAMVFQGFREYNHVEQYSWAYLMEKHFLKSDKEKENPAPKK